MNARGPPLSPAIARIASGNPVEGAAAACAEPVSATAPVATAEKSPAATPSRRQLKPVFMIIFSSAAITLLNHRPGLLWRWAEWGHILTDGRSGCQTFGRACRRAGLLAEVRSGFYLAADDRL